MRAYAWTLALHALLIFCLYPDQGARTLFTVTGAVTRPPTIARYLVMAALCKDMLGCSFDKVHYPMPKLVQAG